MQHQGGMMLVDQLESFRDDPLFSLKIKIRQFDDGAKVCGKIVPELETYKHRVLAHLNRMQY